MTAQERQELAHLYDKIVEWRREDSDRMLSFKSDLIEAINDAVGTHQNDCTHVRLTPMSTKVDWLYDNAKKHCAEAQMRRRWQRFSFALVGAACTAIGVATPYILRSL